MPATSDTSRRSELLCQTFDETVPTVCRTRRGRDTVSDVLQRNCETRAGVRLRISVRDHGCTAEKRRYRVCASRFSGLHTRRGSLVVARKRGAFRPTFFAGTHFARQQRTGVVHEPVERTSGPSSPEVMWSH